MDVRVGSWRFIIITLIVGIVILSVLAVREDSVSKSSSARRNRGETYLDNNATSPCFEEVISCVADTARVFYANPSSLHGAGQRSRAEVSRCRSELRDLVKASNYGIIFTSGATESNNLALRSVVTQRMSETGASEASVVTTPMEHPSVYETLAALQGVTVVMLSVDASGRIDIDELHEALKDERVAVVAVSMANSEIGTIQDVHAITAACRGAYVHCHLDMTQVFGRYQVSLNGIRADSVTLSAHKFHGPKGVGALFYTLARPPPTPCTTGGKQEQGLRGGTENVPGIAGMSLALQMCMGHVRSGATERLQKMLQEIKDGLADTLPGVTFRDSSTSTLYQTLSVVLPVRSALLVEELSNMDVYLGVGGCACSKGQYSRTLEAMGASKEEMARTIRISLGFLNDDRDVTRFLRCTRLALARLKK
ncbi:putative cysteine desulfurase [Tetrabaena socialis]|uniref:Putative cysteine desulfurase n=1 Tax=Tetrabaena socialis TaxID=47790 RepID=A0A2J7ZVZ7_9CHLO|nr:putative cysteine desulfurase [Tetrabaena socialis]|eukprot:PNH04432.1 putative cysteine desulfurase [Tetrabaena socialis]